MATSNAGALRRDGTTVLASGTLDRAAATALWPQVGALLAGATTLDLSGVSRLDSAGLALLAEIAAGLRSRQDGAAAVTGTAPGLEELRAAYRLSPALDFQA
jgi:phospholipid transport system transporter-binding protein